MGQADIYCTGILSCSSVHPPSSVPQDNKPTQGLFASINEAGNVIFSREFFFWTKFRGRRGCTLVSEYEAQPKDHDYTRNIYLLHSLWPSPHPARGLFFGGGGTRSAKWAPFDGVSRLRYQRSSCSLTPPLVNLISPVVFSWPRNLSVPFWAPGFERWLHEPQAGRPRHGSRARRRWQHLPHGDGRGGEKQVHFASCGCMCVTVAVGGALQPFKPLPAGGANKTKRLCTARKGYR